MLEGCALIETEDLSKHNIPLMQTVTRYSHAVLNTHKANHISCSVIGHLKQKVINFNDSSISSKLVLLNLGISFNTLSRTRSFNCCTWEVNFLPR
jgi:hypothetical protein